MNKNAFLAPLLAISVFTAFSLSFAAEAKKPVASPVPQTGVTKQLPRPAFAMISGTLVKIDTADPTNMKVEVKSEADGKTHVISVSPTTQITKITDIKELKNGDEVRVYARKTEDKEIAMGIYFGKLAARPTPKPVIKSAAPITQVTAAKGAKK